MKSLPDRTAPRFCDLCGWFLELGHTILSNGYDPVTRARLGCRLHITLACPVDGTTWAWSVANDWVRL